MSTGLLPPLSIVMPAHNEAANIDQAVCEWHDVVAARLPGTEIIVVDDASRDETGARLEALAARMPALRVVRLTQNVGHGPATRKGLDLARGLFVFQTDSDRQHTPEDFWSLWERRESADFLFGMRAQRADAAFRLFVSRVLRGVNFLLWGCWIGDANCPFKLMRRESLQALLPDVPRETFIPMVMIAVLARRRGFAVEELPVRHFPRTAGEHSLTGMIKWMRVGRRCLRELLALRSTLRRDAARARDDSRAGRAPAA